MFTNKAMFRKGLKFGKSFYLHIPYSWLYFDLYILNKLPSINLIHDFDTLDVNEDF